MQRFLDAALVVLARGAAAGAFADPAPFLHQEFLVLAVGLQIDGGDDVLAASPSAHRLRWTGSTGLLDSSD
jgi:hypothetical protein